MICKTGCQRKSKTCNLQFDTSLVVCCRGGKARRIGSTSQEQRIRTHRAVRVAVAVVERVRHRTVLRAEPRPTDTGIRADAVDADAAVLARCACALRAVQLAVVAAITARTLALVLIDAVRATGAVQTRH